MFKSGRYSGFLRAISYGLVIFIIYFLVYKFFEFSFPYFNFIVFITLGCVILSLRSGFYEIYRFTHAPNIMSLLVRQGVVFGLIVFAFFGFYNNLQIEAIVIIKYIMWVMLFVAIVKFSIYFLLKKFRLHLGGNTRNVIIVGLNQDRKSV